jgi:phosphatidate cytidylyltransferase
MDSNTVKRIISALVMALIASYSVYFGKETTYLLIFIVGIIVNDEIVKNFFKRKRSSMTYQLVQIIYTSSFLFLYKYSEVQFSLVLSSALLSSALLIYLFAMPMKDNILSIVEKKTPVLIFLFTLLPMGTLVYLLNFEKWELILLLLLLVNFGMDTGAWFFGKLFGKHKLWPKISPKKTIEGLVGGMLTSGVIGHLFWFKYIDDSVIWIFVPFAILGFLSQLGDLVQSKFKRQFNIKDSSSLIPGHGGMYDRIDSLVFVLPFFAIVMNYYYM